MALIEERNTPKRDGNQFSSPLAAGAKIYEGGIVCLGATGFAVPASAALNLKAIGIAQGTVDNTDGDDGDVMVTVEPGVHRVENSDAADEITRAEIGKGAYLVDDETVAKTNGSGARSFAGPIVDVDDDGVWIDFSPKHAAVIERIEALEAP